MLSRPMRSQTRESFSLGAVRAWNERESVNSQAIWFCKIGETDRDKLPDGSDAPMRRAVRDAYVTLTGIEPDFIFSGWGAELLESERAVVEDREPVCETCGRGGEPHS
jgi:hypothetical protein